MAGISNIGGIGNLTLPQQGVQEIIQNNTADSFEAKLKKAYEQKDMDQLKSVCQDFESIFLSMMYKQMKATIPESELMPKSSAEKMFEEMLDEELINGISNRGIGLAQMMFKQLSRQVDNLYTQSDSKDIAVTSSSQTDEKGMDNEKDTEGI